MTFLSPIFGVAWGALFLREPLGPGVFVGRAIILAATALVAGFLPRPARPPAMTAHAGE